MLTEDQIREQQSANPQTNSKQPGHRPGMAQFWLDQFLRVEYDAMQCCSIAYSQLGQANIEHNNGDDYGDDGHAYDPD